MNNKKILTPLYQSFQTFLHQCLYFRISISVGGGMGIEYIFSKVDVLHFWMAFVPLSERLHYHCSQLLVGLIVKINVKNPKGSSRIMWRSV